MAEVGEQAMTMFLQRLGKAVEMSAGGRLGEDDPGLEKCLCLALGAGLSAEDDPVLSCFLIQYKTKKTKPARCRSPPSCKQPSTSIAGNEVKVDLSDLRNGVACPFRDLGGPYLRPTRRFRNFSDESPFIKGQQM